MTLSPTINKILKWLLPLPILVERVGREVVVVREPFSLVTSVTDLCADQRSQVRGYEDCFPHGSSFHLLMCSYHSGFIGTISILFCYVNIKLLLCRLALYACMRL